MCSSVSSLPYVCLCTPSCDKDAANVRVGAARLSLQVALQKISTCSARKSSRKCKFALQVSLRKVSIEASLRKLPVQVSLRKFCLTFPAQVCLRELAIEVSLLKLSVQLSLSASCLFVNRIQCEGSFSTQVPQKLHIDCTDPRRRSRVAGAPYILHIASRRGSLWHRTSRTRFAHGLHRSLQRVSAKRNKHTLVLLTRRTS